MPFDHCFRLDDYQARPPAVPQPGQPDPEDTVAPPQLGASGGPLQNYQLLQQRQIFHSQGSPTDNNPSKEQKGYSYQIYSASSFVPIRFVLQREGSGPRRYLQPSGIARLDGLVGVPFLYSTSKCRRSLFDCLVFSGCTWACFCGSFCSKTV